MSEWIKPDKIHTVPIEGGELHLAPSYDVLHRWKNIGFNILRYWDMENGKMCNVAVDNGGAEFLIETVGLFAIDREAPPNDGIFEHEHEIYIRWAAETMTEADFGLDFAADIDPPEQA